jgi:hypothetical protein
MKKQTAVEWLVEQLNTLEILVDKESQEKAFELFDHAKAMERQNIKEACIMGWIARQNKPINTEARHSDYADVYLKDYYGL